MVDPIRIEDAMEQMEFLLHTGDVEGASVYLHQLHPADGAEVLAALEPQTQAALVACLEPQELAAQGMRKQCGMSWIEVLRFQPAGPGAVFRPQDRRAPCLVRCSCAYPLSHPSNCLANHTGI